MEEREHEEIQKLDHEHKNSRDQTKKESYCRWGNSMAYNERVGYKILRRSVCMRRISVNSAMTQHFVML